MNKLKVFFFLISANDFNEFTNIVDSYNRLCESIPKKCNKFRKKEYLYWIKIRCSLASYT